MSRRVGATLSPPEWFCLKIGNGVDRLSISLPAVGGGGASRKTVSINCSFWKRKESRSRFELGPTTYQLSALPLGQAGSQVKFCSSEKPGQSEALSFETKRVDGMFASVQPITVVCDVDANGPLQHHSFECFVYCQEFCIPSASDFAPFQFSSIIKWRLAGTENQIFCLWFDELSGSRQRRARVLALESRG